jgi:hypothetical protein
MKRSGVAVGIEWIGWLGRIFTCSPVSGSIQYPSRVHLDLLVSMKRSWACIERATVAVFGLLLACIFGVLLAWMVMAVGVGTDDKGKTSTSTEKIEVLRVRPVPTDPARTGKKSPRRRWSGSGPLHSSGARAARLARA